MSARPTPTIGVLGGGQLGRMLGLAGIPLGFRFVFVDPDPDAPAAAVGRHIKAPYDDREALTELVSAADVVTFEFENVPAAALEILEGLGKAPVRPGVAALRTGQDRLTEKTLFREVGLGVPEFRCAATADELSAAVVAVGTPCVVKSRRMGYDGKGQAVVREPALARAAWEAIAPPQPGVIVESLVPFTRELSILGVRGLDGSTAFYPLVENVHEGGILRRSLAPAPGVAQSLQARAEQHASAIMSRLGYVGVLAIELFDAGGVLLGNEMAPRVHNSGHWTIEGSACSQFENHLRAVLGLPLGSVAMTQPAAGMVNLIGSAPAQAAWMAVPGAHVHWYGKEPRPGRKVGHVTFCGDESSVRRGLGSFFLGPAQQPTS